MYVFLRKIKKSTDFKFFNGISKLLTLLHDCSFEIKKNSFKNVMKREDKHIFTMVSMKH